MQKLEKLTPARFYHVYNRGNNREDLFLESGNYEYFLGRYRKYLDQVAETYAYCMLRNHFHFLIRIRNQERIDPSRAFAHCFNSYAKSFNRMYNRTGSLFQERFRRREVVGREDLRNMVRYIHHNPSAHHLVSDFRQYEHSSYRILLSEETTFLQRSKVLRLFGGREDFKSFHDL